MTGPEGSRRLSLFEGLIRSELTVEDVWLAQVELGGEASHLEVEAYLLGVLPPGDLYHDILAQALNEHFLDSGQDHPVAYSDSPDGRPG